MATNTLLGLIICAVAFIPMLIFSFILMSGRGAGLIAGYNTMSKEKKARWNVKRLCVFTGWLLLVFTVLLAAAMFSIFAGTLPLFWVLAGLAVAELIAGVIYVNTSKSFKV